MGSLRELGCAQGVSSNCTDGRPTEPATILLIEDEVMVREVLQKTLERSGFRVLVAGGGNEALDLCESTATPIDLVLTDIVMPGTSGTDLAGYLAIRYPWMRTVRMSGFTEAMLSASGMRRDDSPFLQKPFCREELLATVERALAGRGARLPVRSYHLP